MCAGHNDTGIVRSRDCRGSFDLNQAPSELTGTQLQLLVSALGKAQSLNFLCYVLPLAT